MEHRVGPSLLALALASLAAVAASPATSQNAGSAATTPPATATRPPANTAAPPPAASTKPSSSAMATGRSTLAAGDRKFVEKAVQGSVAEVQLGQLAVQKAQSAEVKKFGQHMIDDHSAANNKLQQIASQKGVTPPTTMAAATQREYDKLQKLSGPAFDREYMKMMVSDHQKDVKEFQSQAQSAKDSDVKTFAESTLPTLQMHLDMAKQAQAAADSGAKTTPSA